MSFVWADGELRFHVSRIRTVGEGGGGGRGGYLGPDSALPG